MTKKQNKRGRPRKGESMADKIEFEHNRREKLRNNSFQPKTNDVTEYDYFTSPFRARFTDFVSSKSSYR